MSLDFGRCGVVASPGLGLPDGRELLQGSINEMVIADRNHVTHLLIADQLYLPECSHSSAAGARSSTAIALSAEAIAVGDQSVSETTVLA